MYQETGQSGGVCIRKLGRVGGISIREWGKYWEMGQLNPGICIMKLATCRRMQVLRRTSQEKNMAPAEMTPSPESLTPDLSESISKLVSHDHLLYTLPARGGR